MKKIVLPRYELEQVDITTYFSFENDLWIGAEIKNNVVYIKDMYYGNSDMNHPQSRKGFGTMALTSLKDNYDSLVVDEVTEDALPFWEKMVSKGIVKEIRSYWPVGS